ncbi:cation-translocating P-type ATPase [Halobacterium litoreum]|uniref:Cation-translocating P-type ATPase n=1 Tax=Halobacterium litoreum TaxID=2039234 RepID=A0ABD5NC84_9EURY|nr:cation-transporting P-type ATPase [Halobacterium litoreum]UHH14218.1 cation-transporting P-type ATPase [Halobacterium litoreum]
MDWHATDTDDALDAADSDRDGLTDAAAERRLAEVGPNELVRDGSRHPAAIFAAQFRSALIWVLVVAAALAFAAGKPVDAVLIAVIVFANGVFGFAQEYRAERSLDALRDAATPNATVRRNGERTTVPADEVVPGDVVLLEQGDVVPADARVLDARLLEVEEAALTGESLPVEKSPEPVGADTALAERTSVVYKGTSVVAGRGEAVVFGTGMDTEVGAIATGLAEAEDPRTPLQTDLDQLGRRLGVAVAVLAAAVVALLVARDTPLVQAGLAAVSLAVAAIPEGLPAVVTFTLALGVRRLARDDALVRRLPAVEALGSVDVVVTDKTGTLTEGEMRVRKAWVYDETLDPEADDERLDRLFEIGAVCNDAPPDGETGTPTERALVRGALDRGIDVAERRDALPRRDEIPFSADRKRMTTVHEDRVYVKGAPAVVLERSTRVLTPDGERRLDDETRELVAERVDDLAGDALRVLGFAYRDRGDRDPDSDLVFVGLQGLLDPPRDEVADAIADTKHAGVAVKMVTGDNRLTAAAIGRQVGVDSNVLEGSEVDAMSDEELRKAVEDVDVFARTVPAQKVRILRALQANGHRVAMTGDGVNDAPALKNADVGVAMGVRGTEVARQASDVVLLDDDYATIRSAIRGGRAIFDNVWKFVAYLLSANLAEVLLVFVASLFGYLILPAVQLLWINLLTDGLPALALGTDPDADDVMERKPRRGRGVVDRSMLTLVAGAGLVTTAFMLAVMVWSLDGAPAATPYAVTMVFTGFVVFEFAKLYVVRWTRHTPPTANPWLTLSVLVSFGFQLAVLYTPLADYFGTVPLSGGDWLVLLGAAAAALPLFVGVGALARRRDPTVRE